MVGKHVNNLTPDSWAFLPRRAFAHPSQVKGFGTEVKGLGVSGFLSLREIFIPKALCCEFLLQLLEKTGLSTCGVKAEFRDLGGLC